MNLTNAIWKPKQRYGEDYGLVYEDNKYTCKIGAKQDLWSLVIYEDAKLIINKFNISLLETLILLDDYKVPVSVVEAMKIKQTPYQKQPTNILVEAFNQDKYKAKAHKWLKRRFGKSYNFVHKPNLADYDKTYHCSIDGVEFSIKGRKYDTTDDGVPDTVAYKIVSAEEEKEEEGF